MSISLQISPASMASFRHSLDIATRKVVKAADAGLDKASSQAFALTKARTPKVTGALIKSGQQQTNNTLMRLGRTISFGNSITNPRTGVATSKYAPMVHEVYNPKHPSSYKWFEYTIREYGKERFMNDLADAIKSAL